MSSVTEFDPQKKDPQSSHVSCTVIQVNLIRDHSEKSGVDLR